MAPVWLKTNHNLVVTVYTPKAPSTRRRHQRKLEKEAIKRGQKQKLQLCDFPADLVANIVEWLSSADRIRFGATCKYNLSLVTAKNHRGHHQYQFREIDKLPWLATFTCQALAMTNLSLDFSLFEPLHVRGLPNYATYKIKNANGEGFGGLSKIKLKASNKGWFLGVWPTQGRYTSHLTSFLLFSPFKKRIIKLPDLDRSFEDNAMDRITCQAAFSTDPSSPDCVYFFLSQNSIPGKFRISTLDHQTSKQWKTTWCYRIMEDVSSVVYNGGCFYCSSSIGQLVAYDIVRQSLKSIILFSSPISYLGSRRSDVQTYMVVCEGKLILAVMDKEPLNYKEEMNSCALFEFSCFTRKWVKITSLGSHALFLGQSSCSVRVSDPSSLVNIADRAYFYSDSYDDNDKRNLFYYSLKDGQCHAAKGSSYWSSDVQRGIWIEPPCLTSSPSGFA